ncbi:MAG: hypothetical protein HY293_18055 [Planctomycetes bacterium]|nr:hypothetical protein [Planctomycetota bacterium]
MILAAMLLMQAVDPELVKALETAAAAERYAFKVEISAQGGENAQLTSVEGRVQKDLPIWLKSGELEVYRKGEALAILRKGEWWPLAVKDSDRRKGRGAASPATLRTLRLPHEDLAGITKQFKEIRKLEAKEGDQTVYLGEMTDEAAKLFLDANTERRLEGPPTGTGRFWVTAAGDIAMVEIIVRVKGKGKGRDAGVSMYTTLSKIGTARAEVPPGAIKALEEK